MKPRARKILEGTRYVAMLGADLVPVLFVGAYGLILGLWSFWLGVLTFTVLGSIVGVIVGPWRLRRRLVLWYACIAATALLLGGTGEEQHWPILNGLLAGVGLIGLLACTLPMVWLSALPSAER